jgi:hypothetical protein
MNATFAAMLLTAAGSVGTDASHRTTNFTVEAPTTEVAQRVAETAERHRKQLAILWLGKEIPAWASPCLIEVTITLDRPWGLTTIQFNDAGEAARRVQVKGPFDRILKGPLPHELAHTIFAEYCDGRPPRWADEGAAILSEDGIQGDRQQKTFRRLLAQERHFSMRQLLGMRDYPRDVLCLYAQGHSIAQFLVELKGHKTLLDFVRLGTAKGWDEAVAHHYEYDNVEQLESAWLDWVSRPPQASARK